MVTAWVLIMVILGFVAFPIALVVLIRRLLRFRWTERRGFDALPPGDGPPT